MAWKDEDILHLRNLALNARAQDQICVFLWTKNNKQTHNSVILFKHLGLLRFLLIQILPQTSAERNINQYLLRMLLSKNPQEAQIIQLSKPPFVD